MLCWLSVGWRLRGVGVDSDVRHREPCLRATRRGSPGARLYRVGERRPGARAAARAAVASARAAPAEQAQEQRRAAPRRVRRAGGGGHQPEETVDAPEPGAEAQVPDERVWPVAWLGSGGYTGRGPQVHVREAAPGAPRESSET